MPCQQLFPWGHSDFQVAIFPSPQTHDLSINTQIHGGTLYTKALLLAKLEGKKLPEQGFATQEIQQLSTRARQFLRKQLQQTQNKPTAFRAIPRVDSSYGRTHSALFVKGVSFSPTAHVFNIRVLRDASPAALRVSTTTGLAYLLNRFKNLTV